MREYKIDSFRDEYAFLSNFYEAPVTYNGITYQNNEAAFQSMKCAVSSDRLQFAKLNPTEAKKLGRKVPLRPDWEDIKVGIMRDIVRCKFEQQPELRDKLLGTKDTYLEEGNTWNDRIWGTVNGQGANLLGTILMEIREEFQKEPDKISMEER